MKIKSICCLIFLFLILQCNNQTGNIFLFAHLTIVRVRRPLRRRPRCPRLIHFLIHQIIFLKPKNYDHPDRSKTILLYSNRDGAKLITYPTVHPDIRK
jgi:hypothetical protein